MKKKGLIPQNTVPDVSRVNIYSSLLGRKYFVAGYISQYFHLTVVYPSNTMIFSCVTYLRVLRGQKYIRGLLENPRFASVDNGFLRVSVLNTASQTGSSYIIYSNFDI